MRIIICIFFICIITTACKSQSTPVKQTEFAVNSNTLIYSEADINALRFVVDSLNLKFKSCDLNKTYHAYPQVKVYSILFSSKTNNLLAIRKSIDANIDVDSLLKTYASFITNVDSNMLLAKLPLDEEKKHSYLTGNAYSGFDVNYSLSRDKKNIQKGWSYEYTKKDQYYEKYSLSCIYLPKEFDNSVIPDEYAKLIQYVDCMIDTSTTIFLTEKDDDPFERWSERTPAFEELHKYVNNKMKLKKKKDEYDYFSAEKLKFTIDSLRNDPYVIKTVNAISNWYIKNGGGDDNAEELIAVFISKKVALDLKRKRRVMGACSMDQSPRWHAKGIAILAAETHSWDIFLRAHLDIMNDRFERMTDGSYAYGQRQTYIKELETLDINVIDMMLGLSLRSYNVSDNHYNGTVWRIGRALSESKDRLVFEERAKKIMKDNRLDEFNRSLIFMLYRSYLSYLTDNDERKQKVELLKKEKNDYPDFIQSAISSFKENEDE